MIAGKADAVLVLLLLLGLTIPIRVCDCCLQLMCTISVRDYCKQFSGIAND